MSTSSAEYRVRVLPERHQLEVELTLRGAAAEGDVRLTTPAWVPGAYGFVTIARDVFEVRAEDAATGDPLEVVRDGWQGYRVAGARGAVRVSFRASAYDTNRGEIAGLLDDRYAVLLGARYLHAPAHTGPCRVAYALPAGWKVHHPAGARRVDEATWEYPSFEILLDTPVVAGEIDVITRRLHDKDFSFVFVDRGVGFESEAPGFADDVMKVAEGCHAIFGSFPFEAYAFVLTLNPASDWGLEHLTSTMCGLGPDVFVDPDERARGVRVCAHELFHAWNVRRLRPAPLGALDLERGSFTEGLWVAEGFTRYYEFLLCARAGVYTAEQFFANVLNYHEHLAMTPAYARVTAVDSSLGTYLNHSRYPGSVNDTIDYYDKGMLIAFDLDAAMRLGDGEGRTLDAAMRSFYEQHAGRGAGYTTGQVVDHFGAIDPGLAELLRVEALGRGGLSVLAQLGRLGFRIVTAPVRYLGVVLQGGGGPVVENVADTSPAGFSGLAPGDRIVRANGYPFSARALAWIIGHEPRVDLEVVRGHRPLSFSVPTTERTRVSGLTWEGTDAQAARIRAWLGRDDFRPAPGQSIPLDFYENFHGVQTLV